MQIKKAYNTEGDMVKDLARIKGEPFKKYREEWDAVNNFELETDFPRFLHIEPNFICNFRCPMCSQGIPELKEKFGYKEKLGTPEITRILDEAAKYNCPSISFQGDNEPFLIKEIPEWFEMARDRGFQDIMVNSNGSFMNEQLARRLVKSGLTRLRFSLDSVSEETYNKIRIGGKFAKTIGNIELFLKIREEMSSELPRVGVNFVVMNVNRHEVEPFIERWNDKVDFIVFQDFMTPDTEGEFDHLDVDGREPIPDFKCNQPWQRLYIRGNGDVTPCCAMFSSYLTLGNIKEHSLVDLWNSEQARELRKIHAEGRYQENETCLKCSKSGGGG